MKDLERLYALSFLASLAMGASFSIIAPYLRLLGFSPAEYGLLSALLLFVGILSTAFAGWASDRVGAKQMLIASLLLESLSLLLLFFGSPLSIYASYVVAGVAGGISSVAGIVLATRVRGAEQLEKALPYVGAATSIGGGIGLLGGWVPQILSERGWDIREAYSLQFLLLSLLIPLFALPLLMPVREIRRPVQRGAGEERAPWGILARLVLVNALVSLGAGMSIHIIDYYFVMKFNVKSGELGTVLGAQSIIMGLLMLLTPRVSVAVGGPLRAYILIASPSVLLLIAMAFAQSYYLASIIYIVRTILMNVANPLYQAFEMSLIPREYRGRGASLISIAWQLPAGVGRAVGGALMGYHLEAPLFATAALYFTAFLLLAAFFPSQVLKTKEGP
ncbi:MAG: MFS transporter [Acidilobaceae archaeon]|nr:MFS transporter [Acidilobaceae archaeon]